MILDNIRETVKTLFNTGKAKKEIARYLGIDIKTVRKILNSESNKPKMREDKIIIDESLLRELYTSCDGYAQRIYEILNEDYNIPIGYSTLTRLVREYNLRKERGDEYSRRYLDIPGQEFQQDTSIYHLLIGGKRTKVVCSGLYYRYSKMRYVKFYHRFNRFLMKCFFHEALSYFECCAKICIIDNTNLAVLYGSGEKAVFHPEMLAFAKCYGFQWKAHRIRHANRKAGKERNFLTLATNFFPGRSFKDFDDLNAQAKEWATERFANRPLSKSRLIPSELFKLEKPYLIKLSSYIEPPYQYHNRSVDKYGYLSFDGNYYLIPSCKNCQADIIRYEKRIHIYRKHEKLTSYKLPAYNIKNETFFPEGYKQQIYKPNNKKKGYTEEEKKLRNLGHICSSYIDFIKSKECGIKQKPRFIRELYRISKKINGHLLSASLERALKYKVSRLDAIERIAGDFMKKEIGYSLELTVSDGYEERESYLKGKFSSESDLNEYQKLIEQEDDDGE